MRMRRPTEALWDFLSDYSNVVAMGAPVASARLVGGDPSRCDSVYEADITWQGSTTRFTARMLDGRPPQTLSWDALTSTGRSCLRFDLEPIGSEATLVNVTLSYEARPRAHTLEALTWGFLCGTLERTLHELSQLNPSDTWTP